jgi:hypothetical protein
MKDEVGFESSDTFNLLSERIRSLRANRDVVEWSSISLEMQGVPIKKTRSYGEARIDNALFRNLSGGEPTSFRVEPGQHTVAVHLSRWLRLSNYRGSSKLSIQVAVRAGEQVKLVCGLRPGAKEEWRMIQIASMRPILVFCTAGLVAAGSVWFISTLVGRLIAPATIFIQVRGLWVPPTYTLFALKAALMACAIVAWWSLGNRLILAPNRRVLQSLSYRFVYPYFLKQSEEALHGRQPAL